MTLLIELHSAATWALAGLIWTVQIVHYPLFSKVGVAEFREYHAGHTERMSRVVAPLMCSELLTAGALWSMGWRDPWFLSSLPLLGFSWLSTALLQVPLHRQLAQGLRSATHRRLVLTNWARTAAWTARSLCLMAATP
jgi:hypothetical protein